MVARGNSMELIFYREDLTDGVYEESKESCGVRHVTILD